MQEEDLIIYIYIYTLSGKGKRKMGGSHNPYIFSKFIIFSVNLTESLTPINLYSNFKMHPQII